MTNVHLHVHADDDFRLMGVALFPGADVCRFVCVNIPAGGPGKIDQSAPDHDGKR
jgi:hypothetical protein